MKILFGLLALLATALLALHSGGARADDNLKIAIDAPVSIGEAILFAISPWDGWVDLTDPGTSDAHFRTFLGV